MATRTSENNKNNKQKNKSACAAHFLVHFIGVHHATMMWNFLKQHSVEDVVNTQWLMFHSVVELEYNS